MTPFIAYTIGTKFAAAFTCTLFSYLSSRHTTAPTTVWRLFLLGFGIWTAQIVYNGYLTYYGIDEGQLSHLINGGILNSIKLISFVTAVVMMNAKYKVRETQLWST